MNGLRLYADAAALTTMRVLFIIILAFLALGCKPSQIVYHGTSAYNERISTFKVTPDAAGKLAETQCGWFHPDAGAVIDREYLFSKPYKYARIDLDGIYVNGDTGEVVRRHSSKSLTGNSLTSLLGFPNGMPTRLPQGAFDESGNEPSNAAAPD